MSSRLGLAGLFVLPLTPQDRLEHLRKQCGPHVSAAAKDSVEGICSKIYHISLEYVKRIREKHLAILKEHNVPGGCRRAGGSSGGGSSCGAGRLQWLLLHSVPAEPAWD